MIEKIGAVRNPLTVVAIFAGIAEISAAVVLPFLDAQHQSTFMWFLIGFPSGLVILFFATLNFNPRVLYAPSDFSDEANFMVALAGTPRRTAVESGAPTPTASDQVTADQHGEHRNE